jgi:predicted Zn finger-like uncharacterized protein
MSMYTGCPQCGTYFRVSREQLQASSGQVRCGRCQSVFDAFAALTSQLPPSAAGVGKPPALDAVPSSAPGQSVTASAPPPPLAAVPGLSGQASGPHLPRTVRAEVQGSRSAAQAEILTLPDDLFDTGAVRRVHGRRWPWAVGSVVLVATLLAQAVYFFGTELAVRFPEFRPQLAEVCLWARCTMGLARLADQLFIEASDLQMLDAAQPSEVVLTATIRNRAAVTQELPLIELTLTDALSQSAARKVFYPADYLERSQDPSRGIGPNQEIPLKLYLNAGDIKPTGYRLYLFFA